MLLFPSNDKDCYNMPDIKQGMNAIYTISIQIS